MNTMTQTPSATTTLTLNESFMSRRNWFDWVFAVVVIAGGLFAFSRYSAFMDVYEKGILLGAMPAVIWLGWFWRPVRLLLLVVAESALLGTGSTDRPASKSTASVLPSTLQTVTAQAAIRATNSTKVTDFASRQRTVIETVNNLALTVIATNASPATSSTITGNASCKIICVLPSISRLASALPATKAIS